MVELLDKIAREQYGEFGFDTCTSEEQLEILYDKQVIQLLNK